MNILQRTYIITIAIFSLIAYNAFSEGVNYIYPRFDNFTQRDGLSNNLVQCIYQDREGRMWFGTSQGLSFYDGYSFESYKNVQNDESSIQGELVRSIFQDSKNTLWIGTEHGGLNRFDLASKKFFHTPFQGENEKKYYSANCISEDSKGKLWIASEDGLLFLNEKGLVEPQEITAKNFLGLDDIRKIYLDSHDNIWIASKKHGVCVYNPYTDFYKEISVPYLQPEDDYVLSLFQTKDGNIWVGTYYSGVFVIDSNKYTIQRLHSFPISERNATVRSIIEDADGFLWFGSRGGLLVYDRKSGKYSQFFHDMANPVSLVHNSIIDLYLDRKGDMWIGTRGGISYMDREKLKFRLINEAKNDARYLNNGEVYAFWEDLQYNRLWIGTESGGINILDNESKKITYITEKDGLTSNCIKCFFQNGSEIWIGTYLGGIIILDAATLKVKRDIKNDPNNNSSLISNIVWNIFRDSRGLLWIATAKGLDLYNAKNGTFSHLKHIKHDSNVYWVAEDDEHDLWIGSDDEVIVYNPEKDDLTRYKERTRSFLQTKDGTVWLGTLSYGLAKYHKHNGLVRYYAEEDGLINNNVQSLLADNYGDLWIATFNGVSRFNWKSDTFKNYDEYDGLQDNHFHYNAACKLSNGQIVLGGLNGINIFDPAKVKDSKFEAKVLLRDMFVFNQPVKIGENLKENISSAKEIILNYDQNMFSFTFATLSYSKSKKNQYMYKMDGFDTDWIFAGNANRATYTNLNPGTYTFMVKGANCDGHWNEEIKSVKVIILPPFWMTWWFKILIGLLVTATAFYLIRYYIRREREDSEFQFKQATTLNKNALRKREERFYTALSQELKMPLTYIMGAITEIIRHNPADKNIAKDAQTAEINLEKVLTILNRTPNFENLEKGGTQPIYITCDVVKFIYTIVQPYIVQAGKNKMTVLFERTLEQLITRIDESRLNAILTALLDYAVLQTKEGRSIIVNVKYESDTQYAIQFSFDGEWIKGDKDVLKKGKDGEPVTFGSIKEIIESMNGKITSEKDRKLEQTNIHIVFPLLAAKDLTECKTEQSENDEITILIAENDCTFAAFLKSGFPSNYLILEADQGEIAYEMITANQPDVVVLNWDLPVIDGETLCRRLKSDERTSHIYVIAYSSIEAGDNAITAGVDYYITMPFDVWRLKLRIDNLMVTRYNLKRKYKMEMLQEPNNVKLESPDEKLMNRIMEVVEANMSDSEFGIEKFAQEIGLSRMQLYRKIDLLTKMTVKEFIRNVRIKRAVQLLEQNKMTVSEVAYEVGFKDIAYFRKCFKAQTGKNPSDILA